MPLRYIKSSVPTHRQLEVLKFLTNYLATHPYPPTIRELAKEFDLSPYAIYYHIKNLERLGYLTYERRSPRSLALTSKIEELL